MNSTPITVRLAPDDLELLDLWTAANEPGASRPEALRKILRQAANAQSMKPDFDENPEWTTDDFARARPVSELLGPDAAQALTRRSVAKK